jgi:hypothetical protein
MAGMIAVINSVIVGAFVGLRVAALSSGLPLGVPLGVGVAAFLASVALQRPRYPVARRDTDPWEPLARFPSSDPDDQWVKREMDGCN